MAYRSDQATPQQRFDEKVGPADDNGCRLWLGGTTRKGPKAYGLFYARGQMRPAHRWIYEQTHGEQPAHIDVCHKCDVRLCVNLEHLFAGTRQENMDDAARKGRPIGRKGGNPAPPGEDHPNAILTWEKVMEIRANRAAGWFLRELSQAFGVSVPTIHNIVTTKTWKPT
jgi:hypothetical protein